MRKLKKQPEQTKKEWGEKHLKGLSGGRLRQEAKNVAGKGKSALDKGVKAGKSVGKKIKDLF